MFPDAGKGYPGMPTDFPAANFTGPFDVCLSMQKSGIDDIIRKLQVQTKDPDVFDCWNGIAFWATTPKQIEVPQELIQPLKFLVHNKIQC